MDYELVKSLELEKSGEWDEAHRIVQEKEGQYAYLIHAYLHRVEGDLSNARYWYSRANVPPSDSSLKQEWDYLYNLIQQS